MSPPPTGAAQPTVDAKPTQDLFQASTPAGLPLYGSSAEQATAAIKQEADKARQAVRLAGSSRDERIRVDAEQARELKLADKRYTTAGLTFTQTDKTQFADAYHSRHIGTFEADHAAFNKLDKTLPALVQKFTDAEGTVASPDDMKDAAHQLFNGYRELGQSKHAMDSIEFVAKVASDKNSLLYQALDKANLVDELQRRVLEPAIPFARKAIKTANPAATDDEVSKAILDKLKPLLGPDTGNQSGLTAKINSKLPGELEKAAVLQDDNDKSDLHGALNDAMGLSDLAKGLSGVPTGLAGIGCYVAFNHAIEVLKKGGSKAEAISCLCDGANSGSSLVASTLQAAPVANAVQQLGVSAAVLGAGMEAAGPLLGAVSSAITIKGSYHDFKTEKNYSTGAAFAGDVLGIGSGVIGLAAAASLLPTVGAAVACGVGLVGAAVQVSGFVSTVLSTRRDRQAEVDDILETKVSSFQQVKKLEDQSMPDPTWLIAH